MSPPPVLDLRGVRCRFGALVALDGVDLMVRDGEMLGLIGPNGAGKTTLFNVVTGFLLPQSGSVRLRGRAIDGLSPARRARLGLVRTFQVPALFPSLTLEGNLLVATARRAGVGLRWFGARRDRDRAREDAAELLRLGLPRRHGAERVDRLSHGERRVLDVLLALAMRPRLLLLDEPTAGLSPNEAEALLDAVRHRTAGRAVVLISHDTDVVMARCDRVAAMALGRVLRCGTPAAVQGDPAVQDAYLGRAERSA